MPAKIASEVTRKPIKLGALQNSDTSDKTRQHWGFDQVGKKTFTRPVFVIGSTPVELEKEVSRPEPTAVLADKKCKVQQSLFFFRAKTPREEKEFENLTKYHNVLTPKKPYQIIFLLGNKKKNRVIYFLPHINAQEIDVYIYLSF